MMTELSFLSELFLSIYLKLIRNSFNMILGLHNIEEKCGK